MSTLHTPQKPAPKFDAIFGAIGVFLTAALGGIATSQAVQTWYPTLQKPSFNPPNYLFGPVWTVLYISIAVAYAIAIKNAKPEFLKPIRITFWVQLFFNLIWSYAFFGSQNPLAGLIVIAILWLAIIATIVMFAKSSKLAAGLLFPYLAWVSFATLLNFAIWQLNPIS